MDNLFIKSTQQLGKRISSVFFSDLFWLVLIAFTLRNILDSIMSNTIYYNADSATYFLAAKKIALGVIDEYRTPIYPVFLKLFEIVNKDLVFENIVRFQQVVSYCSIIPFYLLCKRWFRFRLFAFAATFIFVCQPLIIRMNHEIFAESLLISFFIFFFYVVSSFISKPKTYKWIALNAFLFIMVMLKPICIVLYFILIVFGLYALLLKRDHPFCQIPVSNILFGYILSLSLLLGFCSVNKIQNDFFGISTVSHDNNFANVVLSNAYKTIPNKNLVNIIDTIKYKNHYYTIYHLNNDYEKYQESFASFPPQYPLTENMLGVKKIGPNTYGYNRKNLANPIKRAMFSKEYISYIIIDLVVFAREKYFSIGGYIMYLLILFESIYIIFEVFVKKKISFMRTIMVLTTTCILFAMLVGGINDGTRQRVLTPILPFLIYLSCDFVDILSGFLFRLLKPIAITIPHLKIK